MRSIGIEDAGYLDAQVVLTAVVEEQRLGAAFALVVTGPGASGVDVAPVGLRLRVDLRIAIDLAGGGLEDLGLDAFGQAQHVDGPMDTGLGGLYRIELIMDGRGRTGQVIDLVHLHVEREGNVVAHEFEVRIVQQCQDVVLGPGEEVVHTQDVVTFVQESFAEVGAEKTGAAGDKDAFSLKIWHG